MNQELYKLVAEYEQRLIVTWCQRRDFRKCWTPDPADMVSRRAEVLSRYCRTVAGSDVERLGPLVLRELAMSGDLDLWGRDNPLDAEPYYDPVAELDKARELQAIVRLQEGLSRIVSEAPTGRTLSETQNAVRGLLEASAMNQPALAYSDGELMRLAVRGATEGRLAGALSGYTLVDRLTGGLRPGHVWVLGAPTNWGKTSWLLGALDYWTRIHGRPAMMVTCEDAPELVGNRLLCRRARIPGRATRDGDLDSAAVTEAVRVSKDADQRGDAPILIDGRGRDVELLAGDIRASVRAHGIGLVIVDYLQCIRTRGNEENRRHQINHVARTLTDAIKTSGASGILASQLTGEDIRDSRDVEHAAEVVLIGRESEEGRTCFIKKNKTGPKGGVVPLGWDNKTGSFLTADSYEEGDDALDW